MRSIFISFGVLALCCILPVYAAEYQDPENLPNLLEVLEASLDDNDKYTAERLNRIRDLHDMDEGLSCSDEHLYARNRMLYTEFMSFQFDSAFHYVNENIAIARKMENKKLQTESTVELAMVLSIAGMYLESKEVLEKQIDSSYLDNKGLTRYYWVQHRFNRDFQYNTKVQHMIEQAVERQKWYRDRLYEVLEEGSDSYVYIQVNEAFDKRDFARADSLNSILLGRVRKYSHNYAVHSYDQAQIDYFLGRPGFRNWYAISAISDVRSAVKDNAALASLARHMFEDDDIEHAFRFIRTSMDDAIYYNAKLRPGQIAQIMPLIENSYAEKVASANRMSRIFTIFICLFSVLICFFAVFSYKAYRKNLRRAEELHKMNDKLSELNVAVVEANGVKEEYIALLLSMCSDYIDKMEDMQQDIKRKLTIGMGDQLLKELSSSKLMKIEIDNFYNMFDTTFLKLYPDFVSEFNELLREEERIVLPKNSLNTELRIFALIRLGITDSSRIAVLLRYSVQTIYNYRMKMKKRAIYKEDFEKMIQIIGSFRH